MKNRIIQWVLLIFLLPADISYFLSKNRNVINEDIAKLISETPYKTPNVVSLNYLLTINRPFRNIFYFRIRTFLILKNVSRLVFPELRTIEIEGDIGPGFRISHNYAVIHPGIAGKNLFVGHGATIGKNDRKPLEQSYPQIGDNVSIYTNAVVFGDIKIGNNVLIGAGAIVNKDVPDNCTVVGNPCRIMTRS